MSKIPLEEYMTPIQTDIFKELSHGKSLTRRDFVETLGKARTTIYDNLKKLEARKLVKRFKKGNGLRGRPIILWYIPRNPTINDLFKNIGEENNES